MPGVKILRQGSNSVTQPGVQLWSVALVTGAPEHPGEPSLKMPNNFPPSHLPQFFYLLVNGEKIQFQGLSLPLDMVRAPSFLWPVGIILTLGKKEMDVMSCHAVFQM